MSRSDSIMELTHNYELPQFLPLIKVDGGKNFKRSTVRSKGYNINSLCM